MFDESIIQWVQPWTCSHFWVSLPCTLLPGNRSCSATGWCHSEPLPKPTNWQWGQIREVIQPVAGDWWVCGGEGCKSWIRAFCWSPPDRSLALGQWVRWEAHGTAGGCVPQSSRALAKVTHSWAPVCGTSPLPHPYLGGLRSWSTSWVELLAPSYMTVGQGLRTWPWGCCQLRSASS